MFSKKIASAIGLIFSLFFLVGCNDTVIKRAAVNNVGQSDSPTASPSASPSPTPTPPPTAAAPTCSMAPFLSAAGGYQNPGVMITAIVRVTGVATRVSIGIQGGNNSLVTLPYPVTSLFTVTPLVHTQFVGVVEGPGGRSTCGMEVNIVGPNLIASCNGAAAYSNPFCYGDISPMPAGMGSYLTYRDEDVVRATVETRGYCSLWRSGVINPKYQWLASAERPILSIYDAANGMPLATYDLRFMKNDPNRALGIAIDMSPLKQLYGAAWASRRVRLSVCNDAIQPGGFRTGGCFDKDILPAADTHGPRDGISHRIGTAQWSEMSTEFLAGSIPTTFQMGLWWREGAIPDFDPRCLVRQSPLVINFGEAAPETLSAANGPMVDLIGNGIAKKTAWLAPNNGKAGFLILYPGNGKPMKVYHLFGNKTMLPNGQLPVKDHANGFVALALYDSNGDGKINSLDAVWPKLRIWSDENANGKIDGEYELKTMAEAGVEEISVASAPVALTDANNVAVYELGRALVKQAGVSGVPKLILDYWFNQEK